MKKIIAVVLMLTIVLGLCACIQNPAQTTDDQTQTKKITLSLDWTPNTNHTGFYVAQAKGFYQEAGIEVEIIQPMEDSALMLCASNQAQFAIDAQDTMVGALDSDEPLNVTAVATLIQHNTSGIISRKGEGMDRPSGLQGHSYATWNLPIEQKMMQSIVEQDGGDFSQVTMIPNNFYDEAEALRTNQTDAIWVYYAWAGISAEISGLDFDIFYFKDLNPTFDYYTPVLVANNDFLNSDPQTAKAFLEATMRGYEYAIQNPDEAAQILIDGDDTGSLKGSEELVKRSQNYLAGEYKAEVEQWGYIDPTRWDAFYQWLYDNGLTSKNLSGIGYTNDYLPQ